MFQYPGYTDFLPMDKADAVNSGKDSCSHLASHEFGFSGQSVSSAVNVGTDGNVDKSLVNIDLSHGLSLVVTGSQKGR